MNELLAEFVAESRDLIERAGAALLALERAPDDVAALDALFRVMHTIKGGAGFFDEQALTGPLHAGEDLLDAMRARTIALTPEGVDLILSTLDHVQCCFDDMLRDGAAGAGTRARAETLARRLQTQLAGPGAGGTTTETDADDGWPDDLPAEAVAACAAAAGPATIVLHRPTPDCLYGGADPLATALAAPGRLWLDARPVAPWPAAGDEPPFDPYRCNLTLRLLCDAPSAALEAHFADAPGETRMRPAPKTPDAAAREAPGAPDPDIGAAALELLQTQRAALAFDAPGAEWAGRMGAIGATVSAACAATGLAEIAARVEDACDRAIRTHATAAIEALIDEAVAALAADGAAPARPAAAPEPAPVRDAPEPSKAPLTIKVDQEQVDTLMKLVGELIVAKNALPYLVKRAEQDYGDRRMARELKAKYDALHRIVDELQNSVMRIRLVPVGQVFQRFHRVVRDLGRRLDKRIRFELEGEDVRADKNIVEDLAEPLVHLIRNACDHGLEGPAERIAAGKPETGAIVLTARQVEDRIVVELRDDGRGVNIPKVKSKAVALGILTPAAAEAMSDAEAARLILHPGFSTADRISDLSGRGVGMDVVHTMVKRTGGALDVRTASGEGTTVSISLPLSMAVSQVMMFDVDQGLYGVPIEQVVETVRAPARAIHRLQRHEQIVLRGRLIPLMRLRDAFAAPCVEESPDDDLSVLVVRGSEGEVGLVVDKVRSEADVMIEPLDPALNADGVFSGSALLGDGSIMLMVNVRELV